MVSALSRNRRLSCYTVTKQSRSVQLGMPRYPTTDMCDGSLLEAFEPTARDTDVFCSTAAKSGQTWLLALMYHLRTRGLDPDMGGRTAFEVMPWLEIPRDIGGSGQPFDRTERLAQLAALPDPRIFKLHVLYDEIPRPPGSASRVVTVSRDIRDLPYSMYSHLVGMQSIDPEQEDFDAYFERWLDFGYVFALLRSFWPHRHEPHVLWLRYEDMKADLGAQARRLADFLGWSVSEPDLDRVLPLVQLERMQEGEDRSRQDPARQNRWRPGARFFREGGVGKNRSRLSGEQEDRIVERARKELDPECFRFVMVLDESR